MWPNQRMEVERAQNQQSSTSAQQRVRSNFGGGYTDEENELDDEAFHGADPPGDLLFSSIERYAAVQGTSSMRPLPCDCTEVLSVRSAGMASTSYIGSQSYPHIVYYSGSRGHSSTPESTIDDDQPMEQSDDEQSLSEDNESLNSALSTIARAGSTVSAELSPLLPTRAFIWRKTFVSKENVVQKDVPTPEPGQARRRLSSVQRMASASSLATQVANRVIKYARCIRNVHEKDMCCLDCGLFPVCPVTGQCGHTRCIKCIQDKNICPCGQVSLDKLNVNILIRNLIEKTTSDGLSSGIASVSSNNVVSDDISPGIPATECAAEIAGQPLSGAGRLSFGPMRQKHKARAYVSSPYLVCNQRIPMSPRARYNHALELMRLGRYREAAPHLALAAASSEPDLRPARGLLAQVISFISNNRDPRGLTRQLNRVIRQFSTLSIKPKDIECILCCDTFTNPVTTPCGHMFCRVCIERTLDYKKRCPLCLRSLNDFNLAEARDTVFVQAALKSINAVNTPPPLEPDLIPIFVCTVAYPSVPCPLFIFDPRYWLMIRRVLESGSRRFGMVAYDRGQDYADYGTILEVRDCVHLEDGRSILSTIGLSRFKVIERGVRDGCEVARILTINDVPPVDVMDLWELKVLATQIMLKALLWLSRLNSKVVEDIEAAFGSMPQRGDSNEEWWETTDGPSWLWWLVAVLPLRSEIKVLILSTDCLLKRMLAVARTLEAVDQVTLTTTAPTQCGNPSSVSSDENQHVGER